MKIILLANINSTHTKKWAMALKQKKVSVFLFSLHEPVLKDDWFNALDGIYFPKKNSTNLFKKYLNFYFDLKQKIKTYNPDVLHSHYITNYSLLGNLVGFKNHLITTWGSDIYSFPKKNILNKWLIKFNLKKARAIISTSNAMANEISLYSKKSVHVIPFGINFNEYVPKVSPYIKNKKVNIFCFKKIEPIYGTETLINSFYLALKKLPDYDLTLTLVGDGSGLEKMKELAAELKIKEKVVFFGWINSDKISSLLSQSDMCVYLSLNESFGVSLIEAMASKVPLIITKTPGFLEVAVDNKNALFVDFDNPEQTSLKITELILNTELYQSLCENAYSHAREKYNLDDNITEQIELYTKVIDKKI